MKLREIDLHDVSRYRSELMGVAMIFVILFHTFVERTDAFYGLHRMGNVGVDIFLFLSGIGLWFSWAKTPDSHLSGGGFLTKYLSFYWRRFKRIYPVWLGVALAYYVPRFVYREPFSYVDLAGDVLLNWDFWRRTELTFWYVPTTMVFYLFAPLYMELIRRAPVYRWSVVLAILWCFCVEYVAPIHDAVGHLEIFWSRIPIFLIGMNLGEAVRQRRTLQGNSLWLICLAFVVSMSLCVYLEQQLHGLFPLFLERMLYIPFALSTVVLLCLSFRHAPTLPMRYFAWIGGISLEIYLIHFQFVMKHIFPYHVGYWSLFLLTLLIAAPIAWVVQLVIRRIVR